MTDEKKLLADLKRKKCSALEKAIDIYTPYISVIIYNIIGGVMTKEDVEEVVSDTFVSLWRTAETLDAEKGGLRAYLAATARNCARKKLRGAVSAEPISESVTSLYGTPEDELEKNEDKRSLVSLIRELGETDGEIFLRRYWYGEKVSKISAATGINQSTVKTKLRRGRIKLREILMKKEARQ